MYFSLPLYNHKGFDFRSYLNGLVVFHTFFSLNLNFAIRSSWSEWVSLQSCFCWLYRASPSLTAKNIISLILVLAIWWCPCVESSLCCWKKVFVMTSAFSWQNFCQPLPCFILYCKAKFACYSRCFLTSYFSIHTVDQNLLPQSPCKCIEYFIESKK